MANNKPVFTGRVRTQTNRIGSNQAAYTVDSPTSWISVFTAAASVGSYLEKIRIKVLTSTNSATVIKFFTSPQNTHCQYDEIYIPVTTIPAGSATPTPLYEIQMNLFTNVSLFAGCTVPPGGIICITAYGGDCDEITN